MDEWYHLEADKAHIAKERRKAQELKKTQWWKQKLAQGICHYCQKKIKPSLLTMDHIVAISRGGTSTKGNLVVACKPCNQSKKLHTPVDLLLSVKDEAEK